MNKITAYAASAKIVSVLAAFAVIAPLAFAAAMQAAQIVG